MWLRVLLVCALLFGAGTLFAQEVDCHSASGIKLRYSENGPSHETRAAIQAQLAAVDREVKRLLPPMKGKRLRIELINDPHAANVTFKRERKKFVCTGAFEFDEEGLTPSSLYAIAETVFLCTVPSVPAKGGTFVPTRQIPGFICAAIVENVAERTEENALPMYRVYPRTAQFLLNSDTAVMPEPSQLARYAVAPDGGTAFDLYAENCVLLLRYLQARAPKDFAQRVYESIVTHDTMPLSNHLCYVRYFAPLEPVDAAFSDYVHNTVFAYAFPFPAEMIQKMYNRTCYPIHVSMRPRADTTRVIERALSLREFGANYAVIEENDRLRREILAALGQLALHTPVVARRTLWEIEQLVVALNDETAKDFAEKCRRSEDEFYARLRYAQNLTSYFNAFQRRDEAVTYYTRHKALFSVVQAFEKGKRRSLQDYFALWEMLFYRFSDAPLEP